jgi:hypothetical protein
MIFKLQIINCLKNNKLYYMKYIQILVFLFSFLEKESPKDQFSTIFRSYCWYLLASLFALLLLIQVVKGFNCKFYIWFLANCIHSRKKLSCPNIGSIQFQAHPPTSKKVSISFGSGTSLVTNLSLNQRTVLSWKIRGNASQPAEIEPIIPSLYGNLYKNKFLRFSVNI